jgi:hypothetical protein
MFHTIKEVCIYFGNTGVFHVSFLLSSLFVAVDVRLKYIKYTFQGFDLGVICYYLLFCSHKIYIKIV